MKKYTIDVNEEQLRAISLACEFTSRFMSGQMETSYWPFSMGYQMDQNTRRSIDQYLYEVKKLSLGLDPHSSNGYGGDRTSDMLFEAYQSFRHALWKESDENHKELTRHTLSSEPPILCASGIPFPKIEPKTNTPQ
jgi:hypothetical protein